MTQSPLNVVFLDRDTLAPHTQLRPFAFAHTMTVYERSSPEQVAERIRDADIVITNKAPVREAAIAEAKRLKLIAVAATGTDVIDLQAAAGKNIVVSNIRGYAVNTVPEHTFALIFALRRSVMAYHESVKAGRWQDARQFCYFDYPIRDLSGSVIGIIGEGALGQSVADIARSLGMKVLFAARKNGAKQGSLYTPFETVLEKSDIISLHCPLTPETRNLIDEPEFARMKRKPLIINTARGGLVNEDALAKALRAGQISGAGFDVVTAEPPAPDHVFMSLLDMPNFILTPHVAWASDEAMQGLADQLADNVEAFVQGAPRHIVSPAGR